MPNKTSPKPDRVTWWLFHGKTDNHLSDAFRLSTITKSSALIGEVMNQGHLL